MRKSLLIVMFLITAFIFWGCNAEEENKVPSDVEIVTKQPISDADGFSEKVAREKADEFFSLMNFISLGGDNSPGEFIYEGYEYIYVDEELARSFSELKNHLSYLFTDDFSDFFIEASGMIEYEGLLAAPWSIGSDILELSDAVISLESEDKENNIKVCRYEKPTNQDHLISFAISFKKENDVWLIDNFDVEPCLHCG